MKFTTTAMKNGILALLLMSSAASAQDITTKEGADLSAKYKDFRILAKADSLANNDPKSTDADNKNSWVLREVLFFNNQSCGGSSVITADNSFISSSDEREPNPKIAIGNLFDGDGDDVVNIGPRGESDDFYWVGYSAAKAELLGCVKVKQTERNFMNKIEVQAKGDDGNFKTLYIISGITATGTATFRKGTITSDTKGKYKLEPLNDKGSKSPKAAKASKSPKSTKGSKSPKSEKVDITAPGDKTGISSGADLSPKSENGSNSVITASISSEISGGYDSTSIGATTAMAFGVLVAALLLA